jgi:hypothetical protein
MRVVDQVLPFELKERIEKLRPARGGKNRGLEPRESTGSEECARVKLGQSGTNGFPF